MTARKETNRMMKAKRSMKDRYFAVGGGWSQLGDCGFQKTVSMKDSRTRLMEKRQNGKGQDYERALTRDQTDVSHSQSVMIQEGSLSKGVNLDILNLPAIFEDTSIDQSRARPAPERESKNEPGRMSRKLLEE